MADGHPPSARRRRASRRGRGIRRPPDRTGDAGGGDGLRAGHRARPDQLQRGDAAERGRAAPGAARQGDGEARIRAGARLPAVAAPRARRPRVVAGAGLLQDEPAARADLAQDPPRDLLQRRGDGRLLPPRPGDRDLGGRRGIGTAFYTLDQAPEEKPVTATADRVLPALPQLFGQPGVPRAPRPFALRGPAGQSAARQRVVPHRSHEPARRALGGLVRDRHQRPAEAHGQHDLRGVGPARGDRQRRRRERGRPEGSVQDRALPDAAQRHRRADGARAPGRHAQPPGPRGDGDAHGAALRARDQQGARPAGRRAVRQRPVPHPERRRGGRPVHALPRRDAADRPHRGHVLLRGRLRRARPARLEGPVPPRPRPQDPAVPLPVQLPDLFPGVRLPARRGEGIRLSTALGDPRRPGDREGRPSISPRRIARRSSRSSARRSRTCRTTGRRRSPADHDAAGPYPGSSFDPVSPTTRVPKERFSWRSSMHSRAR